MKRTGVIAAVLSVAVAVPYLWGQAGSASGAGAVGASAAGAAAPMGGARARTSYDVREFGAVGDGKAVDTKAINDAIEAASAAGGGTVHFPAGTYLSFSIRLKSNITLDIQAGAKILAATSVNGQPGYDNAEPNETDMWQDFGHSHWHNTLIWGENVHDVAITGFGMIDGLGLRGASGGGGGGGRGRGGAAPATAPDAGGGAGRGPGAIAPVSTGDEFAVAAPPAGGGRGAGGGGGRGAATRGARTNDRNSMPQGAGDKILALKNSHNITVRDVTFFRGGHFCILATGADNMTIDNCKFDTNRDAIDIDCCRNLRISNCMVNAPNDDGLVLKSSFALGVNRATENVAITNCQVSGYVTGSLLDGTFNRSNVRAPDGDGPTGRIKFGTESNGGFKNISISNCVFDHSRGLAMETVDGGNIEDITVSNITMRDICNSPIYIRLGDRARGPADVTKVAQVKRINISNVTVSDANPNFCVLIAGIPGHPIEDVVISNLRIAYKGGGTAAQAAAVPREDEFGYPEPSRLGGMPAYGIFARHVTGLEMHDVEVTYDKMDMRPVIQLNDVDGADFQHIRAQREANVPFFVLEKVKDFSNQFVQGLADGKRDVVEKESLSK